MSTTGSRCGTWRRADWSSPSPTSRGATSRPGRSTPTADGSLSAVATARSSSSTSRMDASCGAGPRVSAAPLRWRTIPTAPGWRSRPVASGSVYVLATESDDGRVLARLANPAHVFHIAWNPLRSNLLAAGIEDSTIRIWDMDTVRITVTLEGDSYNGLVVAFHPGGDILASRGWDGILRLWDIRTGQQILTMPSSWLPELHFDRDGRRLSAHTASGSGGDPGSLRSGRVPLAGPRPRLRLPMHVRALAIDVTGRHLAAASHEGITLWDLPTGVALATLPVTTAVSSVHFDPTGALLTGHPLTLRWPISSSPDGQHDRPSSVPAVVSDLGRVLVQPGWAGHRVGHLRRRRDGLRRRESRSTALPASAGYPLDCPQPRWPLGRHRLS